MSMWEMMEEHSRERKREARIKEIAESDDFQRAYDLHGDFYEGRDVSDEDQEWFDNYFHKLSEENINLRAFSISLYLVYWAKYVTRRNDD